MSCDGGEHPFGGEHRTSAGRTSVLVVTVHGISLITHKLQLKKKNQRNLGEILLLSTFIFKIAPDIGKGQTQSGP